MLFSSRVPLAWLNLAHEKRRLLIRVLGVAFAVFLMFAQLGFYNGLLDAQVQLLEQLNGEIVIVSKAHYAMAVKEPFSTRRLDQALEAPGVAAAYPVYLEYTGSYWKNTGEAEAKRPRSHLIRVIAFNPDQPVLTMPQVNDHRADLKVPDNVLFDRKSKPVYGKTIEPGAVGELAEHTVRVTNTFTLGTDFASDGSIIMSDLTFGHIFPNELTPEATLRLADLGVIRVKRGYDVGKVRDAVEDMLPQDDVQVFTKAGLIDAEKRYWLRTTPIGYIFQFGLVMGFIVGSVICYQIISTDVAEHLPQYATLKAIGYPDWFLSRTVLREALWLAVLGFVPGWGLSWLLYETLDYAAGIPMMFTKYRVLLILGLTILMCTASGLLALRKVKTADPAEVFG